MKKIALALLAALIIPAAAFAAGKEIKVGVTPFPHKDLMNVVKELVAKDGYDLKIVEFTDYVTPNTALAEKALDANFFQHIPCTSPISRTPTKREAMISFGSRRYTSSRWDSTQRRSRR